MDILEVFQNIDKDCKGYATVSDYLRYIKETYSGKLPLSLEDIQYLFRKHDKEKTSRVRDCAFMYELRPL